MKLKDRINIRNKIWKDVWEENKATYTMQDLAEILEIPLTTFFRGIKTAQKVEINQTNNDQKNDEHQ